MSNKQSDYAKQIGSARDLYYSITNKAQIDSFRNQLDLKMQSATVNFMRIAFTVVPLLFISFS